MFVRNFFHRSLRGFSVDQGTHRSRRSFNRNDSLAGVDRPRSRSQDTDPEFHEILNCIPRNEQKVLRRSWNYLNSKKGSQQNPVALMLSVFQIIQERNPQVQKFFNECDEIVEKSTRRNSKGSTIYNHVHMLIRLLDSIICPGQTKNAHCSTPNVIGKLHVPLCPSGFKSDFWDLFGEVFAEVVVKREIVGGQVAAKAWNSMIAVLTDKLKSAFDHDAKIVTSRAQLRRSSSAADEEVNKETGLLVTVQSGALARSLIDLRLITLRLNIQEQQRRSIPSSTDSLDAPATSPFLDVPGGLGRRRASHY